MRILEVCGQAEKLVDVRFATGDVQCSSALLDKLGIAEVGFASISLSL